MTSTTIMIATVVSRCFGRRRVAAREPQFRLWDREIAQKVRKFFDAKDLNGLRTELSTVSKYKFIIDAIAPYRKDARILEVACSPGCLTSYFILAGRDIIGTDISKPTVDSANADFGNRFLSNDPGMCGGS